MIRVIAIYVCVVALGLSSAGCQPKPTAAPSTVPAVAVSQRAKLDERGTCRLAAQAIQDSIPLFVEFSNAGDTGVLDRAPYRRSATALRAAYDVAAASLASNIGTVSDAMGRIVTFLDKGGSVNIDNRATSTAGLTVIQYCIGLGVVPTPA